MTELVDFSARCGGAIPPSPVVTTFDISIGMMDNPISIICAQREALRLLFDCGSQPLIKYLWSGRFTYNVFIIKNEANIIFGVEFP